MIELSATKKIGAEKTKTQKRKRTWRATGAAWFRWFHIYASMICFGAMMFFAFTGITLNHPTWFGASEIVVTDHTGKLPEEWLGQSAKKLEIVEHLRKQFSLRGSVSEFEIDEYEIMVVFKGPGYAADVFIEQDGGNFTIAESQSGFVAVMNDLHKGRDSGLAWSWVIDISAIVMMLASLSGFGLIFYMRRKRTSGLWTAFLGTAIVVLAWGLFVA